MAICDSAILCRQRFNCRLPNGLVCILCFLPLECGVGAIPAYREKWCLSLNRLTVMPSAIIEQAVTMPHPCMTVSAVASFEVAPMTDTSFEMAYICSSTKSSRTSRLTILMARILLFSFKSFVNQRMAFLVNERGQTVRYVSVYCWWMSP